MALLLPILVAIAPLLILPRWSFYFDVVPRIVLILLGAAVALLFLRFDRIPPSTRSKQFLGLVGLQAAATTIATIFSTHRRLSFFGSTWRKEGLPVELAILILAAAIFVSISSEPSRLRLFLRITVLASLPVALYGIAQYFGIDALLPPAAYHFGEGKFAIVRPPSTLGHAAYFAAFLLYPAFAGVALFKSESGRAWKAAAAAASAIASFAMVLSGTRAALLGALCGFLFIAIRDGLTAKRLQSAIGAGIAAALLIAFYVSPAGERLRARVHWSEKDSLGGARVLLWRDTLHMAGARWMVGYGPESFVVDFPAHESIELAREYPDFYHESPHNIVLGAFVSNGVLGLLALVGWAMFGLRLAHGPIGGGFVAMLVCQQFAAFTAPTELYFYVCLALLAAPAVATKRSLHAPPPALRWALAVALAWFAAYLGIGDALLATARRALDRKDLATATRMIDRAYNWHASADIYFSRRFLAASTSDAASRLVAWRDAMDTARSAPQTADDPMNAFVNLASLYSMVGDAADVEKSLRASVDAAPNWFKPHWLLAQVLALEGRITEARAEARAAADRDGGKDAEVSQLLLRLTSR